MNARRDVVVGIYLFDQVELLDFAAPFEVFITASRVAARRGMDVRFEVVTLAMVPGRYQARAGLELPAAHGLHDHPPLDIVVVPGGVVDAQRALAPLSAWLRQQAATVPIVASVCTGAFLLADAGLLDGRRVTTHWEDLDDLARACPQAEVVRGVRWVDTGPIVTSAGISAGIDMSLYLVARVAGLDLAQATARQMDYEWRAAP